jgi:enoyl-CoA hydratase/carnithine racemase
MSEAAEQRVSVKLVDGIADVRLTRPDKRNALDPAMMEQITAAGEQVKAMPAARAVVLSGEGASFCAGLDLGSMRSLAGDGPRRDARAVSEIPEGEITHRGQKMCWVWQELSIPVVAAVHGHALGGGFQLALGADFRIVHPDTQLSLREVYWGLVPDMTGTMTLPGSSTAARPRSWAWRPGCPRRRTRTRSRWPGPTPSAARPPCGRPRSWPTTCCTRGRRTSSPRSAS